MCRSIKPLRKIEGGASEQDIREAALQFVRKVSGYHKPSQTNQEAFESAVVDVALATKKLLENLQTPIRIHHSVPRVAVLAGPLVDSPLGTRRKVQKSSRSQ
jgi:hypothetical protein